MTEEKVLVVDDEEEVREWMKYSLEKQGFKILLASNGKEALEIINKEKIKLAFVDFKLPEIDGLELLHTIKKNSPETEIIIITAYGDYDVAVQALKYGACDYLKKPIDEKELETALNRWREIIKKKEMEQKVPTILLLEDEELVRKKLVRVLQKEGYNVLSASNGEEGMKLFKENKVDLVLTDIKMPKKDGLEVLREVKELSNVEVIVFTGHGDEQSAIEAMRGGAADFLKKPLDLDYMSSTIKKVLKKGGEKNV